ncbi:hypothetical protein CBM2598_U10040 [Cupriavidus taiwanensis]|nr:hypothetical protein CBM2598_U10040 [Cupriavidus taiwanensis]
MADSSCAVRRFGLERQITDYGRPHHPADCRIVVLDCVVMGRAVIPERNGIRLPFETHLVLGGGGLPVQVLQKIQFAESEVRSNAMAHQLAIVGQVRHEGLVDVENLFAAFRVRADDGMGSWRKFLADGFPLFRLDGTTKGWEDVVYCLKIGNTRLDFIGKVGVRHGHIDPNGVATCPGALHASQDRSHRRDLPPGHVAVIDVFPAPVIRGLVELHQLRMVWMVLEDGMHFQFAEAPGKGDVLCRGNVLSAKKQDFVFHQRPAQGKVRGIVKWLAQVDTGDLGPDRRRGLADVEWPGFRDAGCLAFCCLLHGMSPCDGCP